MNTEQWIHIHLLFQQLLLKLWMFSGDSTNGLIQDINTLRLVAAECAASLMTHMLSSGGRESVRPLGRDVQTHQARALLN